MNKLSITMTVSHEFSKEDINDLISTALEGGINYWCSRAVGKRDTDRNYLGVAPEDRDNVQYISDVVSNGGTLVLFDAESSDKWELTLEKMMKGIEMHCTDNKVAPSELMDGYDANDADNIIQYALFGELVFG